MTVIYHYKPLYHLVNKRPLSLSHFFSCGSESEIGISPSWPGGRRCRKLNHDLPGFPAKLCMKAWGEELHVLIIWNTGFCSPFFEFFFLFLVLLFTYWDVYYICVTRKTSDEKPGNQSLTCHLRVAFDQEIRSGLSFKQKRTVDFTSWTFRSEWKRRRVLLRIAC